MASSLLKTSEKWASGKIEELVAKECIPEKFGKLEGCMKVVLVAAKYFS
jgi:hypothetical protein